MLIIIPFAALFMMLIGVLLSAGVVFNIYNAILLKSNGVLTRGIITEVRARKVADNIIRTPVIRFQVPQAGEVEFESYGKCGPDDVGREVEILYMPSRPSKAETVEHIKVSSSVAMLKDLLWGGLCFILGAGVILGQVFLRRWLSF